MCYRVISLSSLLFAVAQKYLEATPFPRCGSEQHLPKAEPRGPAFNDQLKPRVDASYEAETVRAGDRGLANGGPRNRCPNM